MPDPVNDPNLIAELDSFVTPVEDPNLSSELDSLASTPSVPAATPAAPITPTANPISAARDELKNRLTEFRMLPAFTSAATSAWDKELVKENGVWKTPMLGITPGKDAGVLESLGLGMSALVQAGASKFFGAQTGSLDSEIKRLQQVHGLDDTQMQSAWSDLVNEYRTWEPDEKTRVLSDGTISLNPASRELLDTHAIEKIIDESGAPDAAKADAKRNLPNLQTNAAQAKLEGYEAAATALKSPGGRAALLPFGVGGQAISASIEAPSEYAKRTGRKDTNTAAFIRDYERDVADGNPVMDFARGIATDWILGANSVAMQTLGTAGMLGSEKAGAIAAESQDAAAAITAGKPETGITGQVVQQVLPIGAMMVATQLTGGAAALTGSEKVLGVVNALSPVIYSGAQSAGAQYAQSRADGKPHEAAQMDAAKAGATTALITGMFSAAGMGGVEDVAAGKQLAGVTIGDLIKSRGVAEVTKNAKSFAGKLAKGFGSEFPEELGDQITSAFVNADPETNLSDAWQQAWDAGMVGGIMGAGTAGVTGNPEAVKTAIQIAPNLPKTAKSLVESTNIPTPTDNRKEITRTGLERAAWKRYSELKAKRDGVGDTILPDGTRVTQQDARGILSPQEKDTLDFLEKNLDVQGEVNHQVLASGFGLKIKEPTFVGEKAPPAEKAAPPLETVTPPAEDVTPPVETKKVYAPLSPPDRRKLFSNAEDIVDALDPVERIGKSERLNRLKTRHDEARREYEAATTVGDKLRAEIDMMDYENDIRRLVGQPEVETSSPITEEDQRKERERQAAAISDLDARIANGEPLSSADITTWRLAGRKKEDFPKNNAPETPTEKVVPEGVPEAGNVPTPSAESVAAPEPAMPETAGTEPAVTPIPEPVVPETAGTETPAPAGTETPLAAETLPSGVAVPAETLVEIQKYPDFAELVVKDVPLTGSDLARYLAFRASTTSVSKSNIARIKKDLKDPSASEIEAQLAEYESETKNKALNSKSLKIALTRRGESPALDAAIQRYESAQTTLESAKADRLDIKTGAQWEVRAKKAAVSAAQQKVREAGDTLIKLATPLAAETPQPQTPTPQTDEERQRQGQGRQELLTPATEAPPVSAGGAVPSTPAPRDLKVAKEFEGDLKMSGVAYDGDTRYSVHQSSDGTFRAERSVNGVREDIEFGLPDIESAQKVILDDFNGVAKPATEAPEGVTPAQPEATEPIEGKPTLRFDKSLLKAPTGSPENQMKLAARASRISVLLGLNKVTETYDPSDLAMVPNDQIDEIQDYLIKEHRRILTPSQTAPETSPPTPREKLLTELGTPKSPGFPDKVVTPEGATLELTQDGDRIKVSIETPPELRNTGKATAAMTRLVDLARRDGVKLDLDVVPMKDMPMDAEKLTEWYAKLGFTDNGDGTMTFDPTQETPAPAKPVSPGTSKPKPTTPPLPHSVETLKSVFGVSDDVAVVTDALAKAMGIDLGNVVYRRGGKPGSEALKQSRTNEEQFNNEIRSYVTGDRSPEGLARFLDKRLAAIGARRGDGVGQWTLQFGGSTGKRVSIEVSPAGDGVAEVQQGDTGDGEKGTASPDGGRTGADVRATENRSRVVIDPATGGVTIKLNGDDLFTRTSEIAASEEDALARVSTVLTEEVIHAAEVLAMMDSLGPQTDYKAAVDAEAARVFKDIVSYGRTDAEKQAVREAILSSLATYRGKGLTEEEVINADIPALIEDLSDGQQATVTFELVRQITQLRNSGVLTETAHLSIMGRLMDWIQSYLGILKSVSVNPAALGPRFEKEIRDTEAMLGSSDTTRFEELTATIPANPSQADLDAWKATHPDEYQELKAMRERVLREQGYDVGPVWHHGTFDQTEDATPSIGDEGMHFGTKAAAEERPVGKTVDDFIKDASIEYDEDLGAWFWSSQGVDSYDFNEEGFSSESAARADLEESAVQYSDGQESFDESGVFTTAMLKSGNQKRVSDQKDSWVYAVKKAKAEGYTSIVYRNEFEDKGSDSYIVFDPAQIKSTEPLSLSPDGRLITPDQWGDAGNPSILYQDNNATVEFLANGVSLIRAYGTGNPTSAIHEHQHIFDQTVMDSDTPEAAATRERLGITDAMRKDYHDTSGYTAWQKMSAEAKTEKQRKAAEKAWEKTMEKRGRWLERYMYDGIAPKQTLAPLFEKIAGWFRGVYGAMVESTPIAPVVPDSIRKVFDKIFEDLPTLEEILAKTPPEPLVPEIPPVEFVDAKAPETQIPGEPTEPGRASHEMSDQERAALGLPPRIPQPVVADADVWATAQATEDAHRAAGKPGTAGTDLMHSKQANMDFALDTKEQALIIHEIVTRRIALNDAIKRLTSLPKGAPELSKSEAQKSVTAAEAAYQEVLDFNDSIGSEEGRSFRLRRWIMGLDFSYAGLSRRMHAAANANSTGNELTAREKADIKEYADKLEQAQARYDDLVASTDEKLAESARLIEELTADVERGQKLESASKSKVRKAVSDRAAEAKKRLQERGVTFLAQAQDIDATTIKDFAAVAAEWLVDKPLSLAEFTQKLVTTFGTWITDHADRIFKTAKQVYNETAASVTGKSAPTPEQVLAEIEKTDAEEPTRKDVWRLARAYVIAGLRGENVLDSVHTDLNGMFSELTRERTAELFTDYGKTTHPSPDDASRELGKIKNLERIALKIADVKAGRIPKQTGFQRDPETIDLTVRQLEREFRRLYKDAVEAGELPDTGAEGRSKSALASAKTRMRNELEELQDAINRNRAMASKKSSLKLDEEALELRTKLEAKRNEYNEAFPKEGLTDEKRRAILIRNLDRQIAQETQMLVDGILKRVKATPVADTPEITERRRKLAALRQERRDLYDAENPLREAKANTRRAIERLRAIVEKGSLDIKEKKPINPDEELRALIETREALADEVDVLRKASTEYQTRQIENALRAAERSLERIEKKLATGDLSVPAKTTTPASRDAAVQAIRARVKELNADLDARRREEKIGPYSDEARLTRELASLAKRKAELERRLREKDTSRKVKDVPLQDARKRRAQYEIELLKAQFSEMVERKAMQGASPLKKAQYYGIGAANLLKIVTLGFDVGVVLRQLGTTYQALVKDLSVFSKDGDARKNGSHLARLIKTGVRAFADPAVESEIYEKVKNRPGAEYDKVGSKKIYFSPPFDTFTSTADDIPRADLMRDIPWFVWPAIAGAKWFLFGMSPPAGIALVAVGALTKPLLTRLDRAQRAMTNIARADFVDAARRAATAEGAIALKPADYSVLNNAVMVATGRGQIQKLDPAIPVANVVLLATRFYLSRIMSLSLQPIWSGLLSEKENRAGVRARAEVAKMYARSLAGRASLYALLWAMLGRSDDEKKEKGTGLILNPFSSDFGRFKVNDKLKVDFMSGINSFASITARYLGRRRYDATTEKYTALGGGYRNNVNEEASRFLSSKMNLLAKFVIDTHAGQYFGGKPTTFSTAFEQATTAIITNDVVRVYEEMTKMYGKEEGTLKATAICLLMFGGMGASVRPTEDEQRALKAMQKEIAKDEARRTRELNE